MSEKIAVIGGMNIDITGEPLGPLIERDVNPGRVRLSYGGVGRNIAENLVRMGFDVQLVAPIGADVYGEMLVRSCKELGIGLDYAIHLDDPGGIYFASGNCSGKTGVGQDMEVVNATGAEDSATAAIAAGVLANKNPTTIATLACMIASMTLKSENAVSDKLTPKVIVR